MSAGEYRCQAHDAYEKNCDLDAFHQRDMYYFKLNGLELVYTFPHSRKKQIWFDALSGEVSTAKSSLNKRYFSPLAQGDK